MKIQVQIRWEGQSTGENVQSLPPQCNAAFVLFLATSAVKTLSGFHLCHQCYHCYWFSSRRNTLLLLLLLLTLLLRIHSRDPQRFQRLLLLFGLLLFKLLLVWMPDLLSWYWIIVAMLLHISCYFVPVCSLLHCLFVVLVWTIAGAPVLWFLTFCQATQQSPATAYYNMLQNVRNVQSTMLHSGS